MAFEVSCEQAPGRGVIGMTPRPGAACRLDGDRDPAAALGASPRREVRRREGEARGAVVNVDTLRVEVVEWGWDAAGVEPTGFDVQAWCSGSGSGSGAGAERRFARRGVGRDE